MLQQKGSARESRRQLREDVSGRTCRVGVISNMKRSAGKVGYDVACTGEHAMTGHYDFTMTPTSMTGVGTMNMEGGQTMKQNMSAKRVGDCK